MNKTIKWSLILSGYIIVFVLTFIFMGRLAALFNFIQEMKNLSEAFINQIIKIIQIRGV